MIVLVFYRSLLRGILTYFSPSSFFKSSPSSRMILSTILLKVSDQDLKYLFMTSDTISSKMPEGSSFFSTQIVEMYYSIIWVVSIPGTRSLFSNSFSKSYESSSSRLVWSKTFFKSIKKPSNFQISEKSKSQITSKSFALLIQANLSLMYSNLVYQCLNIHSAVSLMLKLSNGEFSSIMSY